MDNVLILNEELLKKTYQHGGYYAFKINDPKPRNIHKANVRDRIVHHAIFRILYPYFEKKFIFDSYSCRLNKGTHKSIYRFRDLSRKGSVNNTKPLWLLKGDIRKFFANIDHDILKNILQRYIIDEEILWLMGEIIDSFRPGLPLGNVTSQLFINIYLNEFDQFVKRDLKVHSYIRYCDDFVIIHTDKVYLEGLIPKISQFLEDELKLSLHPDKVFIKRLSLGVDFLGWVHFSHHRVLRTATKKRMFKRLKGNQPNETLASYLGLLKHGDTYKLVKKLRMITTENDLNH
ncbi:MAG: RNA-directed DNA polymerase (Reverse transcriptase) [Microgenomates group bacterium Gr01-1014_7]|nr:MAG: RNA-directed DNA polymerase (Reverse transcriptase) [Microgenomates group bacterium Gr01-1014_7]